MSYFQESTSSDYHTQFDFEGTPDPDHSSVAEAKAALSTGRPVMIHDFDSREHETDLIYPAGAVSTSDVARLRNDAGGLICVAVPHEVAEAFELPYLQDVLDHPAAGDEALDYDDRSSFSIPVNHRDTRTGIPDEERSLTIRRLAAAAADPEGTDFAAEFRAPGHVNVLKAAPGLLENRQGHTELGLALAARADCEPAVVVCEMLDDTTGKALTRDRAMAYARKHDVPFLEGEQLLGY